VCDTSVVVGSASVDGSVIFAKNSDRPANECQPLRYYPRRSYPAQARVRCTHREIPQAGETLAVLGCQPWWMWGFEIGVNEAGVTIGNEAVYGREGYADDGLLGMDLLRLGLERGRTAYEALRVVVDLLEEFGQGGSADVAIPRSYHNSYIIADPIEAWVLETAGRYWAAEKVKGRRAISNCFTIGTEWDEASSDLIDHAVANGWWARGTDFDFARAYGDPNRDVGSGQCRFARASHVLDGRASLGVPDMMQVLRDHAGLRTGPSGETVPTPICMHEVPPNLGATAASLVVHLRPKLASPLTALVWHSFGSPCLSAFHPIYVAAGPALGELARGEGTFDRTSPWWRNEQIQRRVDAYPALKPTVLATWRNFEQGAFAAIGEAEKRAQSLAPAYVDTELRRVGEELTAELLAALAELDDLTAAAIESSEPLSSADAAHWNQLNQAVGLDVGAPVPAGVD
jgi:dipeptidase